jgi:hypothetical protein
MVSVNNPEGEENMEEAQETPAVKKAEKKGRMPSLKYALLIIAVAIVAFNQLTLSSLSPSGGAAVTGQIIRTGNPGSGAFSYTDTGNPVQDAINVVFYTGQPEWSDGSISYDDVTGSLKILANLDRAIDTNSLDPALKERYIAIGTKISCEYCCGAKAVIFADGRAACGCSHSYALRGIAKYLLTQYGDSYTDEEILTEMTKWKNLFFPKDTVKKAAALIANGMEITQEALNDHQLLQKIETGDIDSIGELQGMVGGC